MPVTYDLVLWTALRSLLLQRARYHYQIPLVNQSLTATQLLFNIPLNSMGRGKNWDGQENEVRLLKTTRGIRNRRSNEASPYFGLDEK